MATRFTHLTFTVSDVDRSIAFYGDLFGMKVIRDRRREGGGTVWLGSEISELSNPVVVLVIHKGPVENRLDHLGFQCDTRAEVDAMVQRGKELNCLTEGPTDSGGSVGYWALFRDPDGHLAEATFGQPLTGV